MSRWRWCCTIALVGGLWLTRVASAADQEALFTEGTLTSVDLNQEHPSIALSRSTGTPLVLQLGHLGEWKSLDVGVQVKLRYTEQNGVYTVESMQIIHPGQAASASPDVSPSSAPTSAPVVEQPSAPSQVTGEKVKKQTITPGTEESQRNQVTMRKQEKQGKKQEKKKQ